MSSTNSGQKKSASSQKPKRKNNPKLTTSKKTQFNKLLQESSIVALNERGLKKKGMSAKAARKVATNEIYVGMPIASRVIKGSLDDIIRIAQLFVLRLQVEKPELFVNKLEEISLAPSAIVGYCVLAFNQRMRDLNQITAGAAFSGSLGSFNESWHVPTAIAKMIEYSSPYKGLPTLSLEFTMPNDFTIGTPSIYPNAQGDINWSVPTIVPNVAVFQIAAYTDEYGDASFYDQPYNVPYSGLYTGTNPLCMDKTTLEQISKILQNNVPTVPLGNVAKFSPDASVFATIDGTTWNNSKCAYFPSPDFSVESAIIFRPHLTKPSNQSPYFASFDVGWQACVPMPTWSQYNHVQNGPQITTLITQEVMEKFMFCSFRNNYYPGKILRSGSHTWKLGDCYIKNFSDAWVSKPLDYYGTMTFCMRVFIDYFTLKIGDKSYTDDMFANVAWLCHNLIMNRMLDVGCPILTNLTDAAGWSPTSFSVNRGLGSASVLLPIKLLLDKIGITYQSGSLLVPTLYIPQFNLGNGTNPNLLKTPKFGFVIPNVGQVLNICVGQADDIFFPNIPCDKFGTYSVQYSGPRCGQGYDANQSNYEATGIDVKSKYDFTLANIPLIGGWSGMFISWFSNAIDIESFVRSICDYDKLYGRGLTTVASHDINGDSSGVVLHAKRSTYAKTVVHMRNHTLNVQYEWNLYCIFKPIRVMSVSPYSAAECSSTLSLPLFAIYITNNPSVNTNTYPVPFETTAIRENDWTLSETLIAEALNYDSAMSQQYQLEVRTNHSGLDLFRKPMTTPKNCALKGLVSFLDRTSSTFEAAVTPDMMARGCEVGAGMLSHGTAKLTANAICSIVPQFYSMYKDYRSYLRSGTKKKF